MYGINVHTFPDCAVVNNPPENAGDTRDVHFIPASGLSTEEGNGNLLQYSSQEKSMNKGVWVSYSPWGCKELETTEHSYTHTYAIIAHMYEDKYNLSLATLLKDVPHISYLIIEQLQVCVVYKHIYVIYVFYIHVKCIHVLYVYLCIYYMQNI